MSFISSYLKCLFARAVKSELYCFRLSTRYCILCCACSRDIFPQAIAFNASNLNCNRLLTSFLNSSIHHYYLFVSTVNIMKNPQRKLGVYFFKALF